MPLVERDALGRVPFHEQIRAVDASTLEVVAKRGGQIFRRRHAVAGQLIVVVVLEDGAPAAGSRLHGLEERHQRGPDGDRRDVPVFIALMLSVSRSTAWRISG